MVLKNITEMVIKAQVEHLISDLKNQNIVKLNIRKYEKRLKKIISNLSLGSRKIQCLVACAFLRCLESYLGQL